MRKAARLAADNGSHTSTHSTHRRDATKAPDAELKGHQRGRGSGGVGAEEAGAAAALTTIHALLAKVAAHNEKRQRAFAEAGGGGPQPHGVAGGAASRASASLQRPPRKGNANVRGV